MIVVLPVCHKDIESAIRNLNWCVRLDTKCPFKCVISAEVGFNIEALKTLAETYFTSVSLHRYPIYPKIKGQQWPRPQNWAWRAAALHMGRFSKEPWFWWEQDAVPLRQGWLKDLENDYLTFGKPFMGAIGAVIDKSRPPHLNGVAIYPSNVAAHAPQSMFYGLEPFDVAGGWRVMQKARISPLFQHVWSWEGGAGRSSCSFDSQSLSRISDRAVIFHRCKDASLITQLSAARENGHVRRSRKLWTFKRKMKRRGAAVQEPPCLIMLSGAGDILIALCIAKHYSSLFSDRPIPFITNSVHRRLLEGASYVQPVSYEGVDWKTYREAIAWAKERYETVLPLHVGEPEILADRKTTHFCHEQYAEAGLPNRYGDFPLVLDRRSPFREWELYHRVYDGRPILLYNFTGRTSPFREADKLEASIRERWQDKLNLVDTSKLALRYYYDLLGLIDRSIGLVTIDTSPIHLMAASDKPYVALTIDTRGPWWSSVPRGNCVLELGYSKAMNAIDKIHDAISTMTNQFTPPEDAPPRMAITTLACNGMEPVWEVAERTWAPYCQRFGYQIDVINKMPMPDLAPSWNKIAIVLSALERNAIVWWVDSDITVAREDSPRLPSTPHEITFASDWNGLCAGMFRIVRSDWTMAFLRSLLVLGDVANPDAFGKGLGVKWEQNAIKQLAASFPEVSRRIGTLPPSFLSDRPSNRTSAAFFHFGAMNNAARIKAMKLQHGL